MSMLLPLTPSPALRPGEALAPSATRTPAPSWALPLLSNTQWARSSARYACRRSRVYQVEQRPSRTECHECCRARPPPCQPLPAIVQQLQLDISKSISHMLLCCPAYLVLSGSVRGSRQHQARSRFLLASPAPAWQAFAQAFESPKQLAHVRFSAARASRHDLLPSPNTLSPCCHWLVIALSRSSRTGTSRVLALPSARGSEPEQSVMAYHRPR
jgi:hypothetical protein